jgi:hypothetical protein
MELKRTEGIGTNSKQRSVVLVMVYVGYKASCGSLIST